MRTTTDREKRTCERCDAEILSARVKALPGTWVGIECSQEVGGDFMRIAKQENLGKAGPMKLDHGGVSVEKSRPALHKKKD
jgi:hypothetical protein